MCCDSGSSAPAPDPRLTDAQIRSMDQQGQMLSRLVANSDELLPLQKEEMRFGLDSARTAYDQSQEDRDWMLTRRGQLSGLQDRMVSDAADFNEEGRVAHLTNQADADVNSSFGLARSQGMRELQRRGVNLSSGRALMMGQGMNLAQAAARASAANKVRDAARAEGFALTDRAQNALAGYPAMGMGATSAGAGYGGMGLQLTTQGLAGMNSGYGQAAGVAGQIGQNATSMYGAQANYKLGSDQIASSGAGGVLGGLGALAGGAANLYASGIFRSDRRLKENIVFVGRHPTTGLNLYEFNYKADPSRRYRGVMADEVEVEYPHAVIRDKAGYAAVDYPALGIQLEKVEG